MVYFIFQHYWVYVLFYQILLGFSCPSQNEIDKVALKQTSYLNTLLSTPHGYVTCMCNCLSLCCQPLTWCILYFKSMSVTVFFCKCPLSKGTHSTNCNYPSLEKIGWLQYLIIFATLNALTICKRVLLTS